ncbi:MAG: hypothetical protein ACE5HP_12695 [Gemmatimonadota bacterium]
MARSVSRGEIECVPDLGLVVVAARQLPILRAYSLDGALAWSVGTIDGFNAMRIEQTVRGSVRLSRPENGAPSDLITSVVSVGGGMLLVQFGATFAGQSSLEEIVTV